MNRRVQQYAHNADLVGDLAHEIVSNLRVAIEARGHASIAVSGGSTPIALFKYLSSQQLDWQKVVITLVDERWVPETSNDSNAKLVQTHLLQDCAADAKFVSLKTTSADPFIAAQDVAATLQLQVLPLDIAILGMGEDGHTASFFPASDGLEEALHSDRVCCGMRPRAAPHARMTLSLTTLLNAKQLYLHIIGPRKKTVLEAAMLAGPVEELPVRGVLQQNKVPLEIYYAESD